MQLSGIDRTVIAPEGGEILRTPDGEPSGVFRETAQGLIAEEQKSAEANYRDLQKAVQLATRMAMGSLGDRTGSRRPTSCPLITWAVAI